MINFVLAWRNLWRNKRRTLITTAMIVMAVVLSVTMQSVQRGIYDRNIDNIVRYSMGYIQVGADGHNEDKTLETSVELTNELTEKIILSHKELPSGITKLPLINTTRALKLGTFSIFV